MGGANSTGIIVSGGTLNGTKFTTYDRDNDLFNTRNCANFIYIIGGFWFYNCGMVMINSAEIPGAAVRQAGFCWRSFAGVNAWGTHNLKISKMTLVLLS